MLAVQTFSVICLSLWGFIVTIPILWAVNKVTPIRLTPEDELLGCDVVEHFMGTEPEKKVIPSESIRFGSIASSQVVFNMPLTPFNNNRNSYRDADTLTLRTPYSVNTALERDEPTGLSRRLSATLPQQTSERL